MPTPFPFKNFSFIGYIEPQRIPEYWTKRPSLSLARILTGMIICADSFKKEILDDMAKLKPDLMLIPYGWAAGENAWPEHAKQLEKTVKNAAQIIGCPVIGTDLVGQITNGPWTGLTYGGASVVADKDGNILAIGKDRDRDILIVEVPIHNQ